MSSSAEFRRFIDDTAATGGDLLIVTNNEVRTGLKILELLGATVICSRWSHTLLKPSVSDALSKLAVRNLARGIMAQRRVEEDASVIHITTSDCIDAIQEVLSCR